MFKIIFSSRLSRRLPFTLAFIAFILLAFNLLIITAQNFWGLGELYGYPEKFLMDEEDSLPTYFSAVLILIAAIWLFIIYKIKRKRGDRNSFHWLMLFIVILSLSIDEIARFHEDAGDPFNKISNSNGFFHFTWIIPGIIFVSIFFILFLKFLMRLPKKYSWLFILSGLIYISGALGFEAIGGSVSKIYGLHNYKYLLYASIEESLEMAGMIVFIYTLLKYIEDSLNISEIEV